jgi:hypothetical protein
LGVTSVEDAVAVLSMSLAGKIAEGDCPSASITPFALASSITVTVPSNEIELDLGTQVPGSVAQRRIIFGCRRANSAPAMPPFSPGHGSLSVDDVRLSA